VNGAFNPGRLGRNPKIFFQLFDLTQEKKVGLKPAIGAASSVIPRMNVAPEHERSTSVITRRKHE
jgi:hypothetical protein